MVLLMLWYSMLSKKKCLGFEPRCGVVDALVFHAEQREVFRF